MKKIPIGIFCEKVFFKFGHDGESGTKKPS
jgi:hypothetical protein